MKQQISLRRFVRVVDYPWTNEDGSRRPVKCFHRLIRGKTDLKEGTTRDEGLRFGVVAGCGSYSAAFDGNSQGRKLCIDRKEARTLEGGREGSRPSMIEVSGAGRGKRDLVIKACESATRPEIPDIKSRRGKQGKTRGGRSPAEHGEIRR